MGALGIILVIVGVGGIVVIGLLVVLSVFGTRRYIANAKTAEAKNALGQMAKNVVTAYEESALPFGVAARSGEPEPDQRKEIHILCR
jgi:hypothetical protein